MHTFLALLDIAKLPIYIPTASISECLFLQTFCARMIKNNFLIKKIRLKLLFSGFCVLRLQTEKKIEKCSQHNSNESRNCLIVISYLCFNLDFGESDSRNMCSRDSIEG